MGDWDKKRGKKGEGRGKQKRSIFAKRVGFLGHGVKHGEYLLIVLKEFFEILDIDIIASQRELEPGLSFGCLLASIA